MRNVIEHEDESYELVPETWANSDRIQTFTGKMFDWQNPKPEDIDIRDIAHALSMQCRFGGHCKWFYSVAEHSINVSRLADNRASGLMHDAAEAYLIDIPRPIKKNLPGYKVMEKRLLDVIFERFNLVPINDDVKLADNQMLKVEAAHLLAPPEVPWGDLPNITAYRRQWVMIDCMLPADAEKYFLARAEVFGLV